MQKILSMMLLLFCFMAAPLNASACNYSSDFMINPSTGAMTIWIFDTNTFETVGYIYISNARGGNGSNSVSYNGKTMVNGNRHQLQSVYVNVYSDVVLDDDCLRRALNDESRWYGIDISKRVDDIRIDGCFDRFDVQGVSR